MIITDDKQDVSISGAESTSSFKIKASAKAFQILSSNLYSNPLGSMIRELSTNAYDAHIMVNKKDVPFHITLPNSLEPTFKIRDFGPGLSPEDMETVYTVIFESTKTNSNDMVGCLGLGSKSPFGVADSFTVISFYNNKKTIYSAFLDQDRIPTLAKFAEFDTDEPSGIEIEIAIKEADFRVFNREVNAQLKYFNVKPLVFGNEDFAWNLDEEYLYQGSNWKMVKNGSSNARVIQGQISYPINTRDLGQAFDNANDYIKEILSRPVLFTVNIGDVNIAPSREALTYDAKTCQNLINYAQIILDELPSKVAEQIISAPNEYQARLTYDKISNDFLRGYYRRAVLQEFLSGSNHILWNNIDVSSLHIKLLPDDIQSVVSFDAKYNNKRYSKNIWHPYKQYHNYNYNTQSSSADEEDFWQFSAKDLDSIRYIYLTDADKSVESRARQFALDNKLSQIVLINPVISKAELASKLGLFIDQIIDASTLPKVRREPREKKEEKSFFIQKFNRSHWSSSDKWQTITVDDIGSLSGFFVNVNNRDTFDMFNNRIDDLKSIVRGAIDLKILKDDVVIYGLKKQNQARPHKLKCLVTEIKKKSKKISLGNKYEFGDNTMVVYKLLNCSEKLPQLLNLIHDSSPIHEVITALLDSRSSKFSNDASRLIKSLQLNDDVIDMSHLGALVDHKYSMIGQVGYYFEPSTLASYIAQIDALSELKSDIIPKC